MMKLKWDKRRVGYSVRAGKTVPRYSYYAESANHKWELSQTTYDPHVGFSHIEKKKINWRIMRDGKEFGPVIGSLDKAMRQVQQWVDKYEMTSEELVDRVLAGSKPSELIEGIMVAYDERWYRYAGAAAPDKPTGC